MDDVEDENKSPSMPRGYNIPNLKQLSDRIAMIG